MKKIDSFAVYKILKEIPKGKLVRYKDIAECIGHPKSVRAIGNILNKNKEIIEFPCHRVVLSSGEVGGYNQGTILKKKLLKDEGICIVNNKIQNFSQYLYTFSKNIAKKKTKKS